MAQKNAQPQGRVAQLHDLQHGKLIGLRIDTKNDYYISGASLDRVLKQNKEAFADTTLNAIAVHFGYETVYEHTQRLQNQLHTLPALQKNQALPTNALFT